MQRYDVNGVMRVHDGKYLFQYRRYRLTLRAPVRTAHGVWTEREGVMVRLEGESGAVGYGEAAVLPWFGTETVEAAEAACREIGAEVRAEQIAAWSATLPCLRNALAAARRETEGANGVTESAVAGNAAEEDGRVEDPPYLGLAALLPAGRAVLAAVRAKEEMGFRVFKWKVGVGDVADELGLLDDVCAVLPPGAKLRLDANGAWDRRKAERWLERCADRPVEFVEQPVAADARGAEDLLLRIGGRFSDGDRVGRVDCGRRRYRALGRGGLAGRFCREALAIGRRRRSRGEADQGEGGGGVFFGAGNGGGREGGAARGVCVAGRAAGAGVWGLAAVCGYAL
jgi:o-succinylbenzoate synthase